MNIGGGRARASPSRIRVVAGGWTTTARSVSGPRQEGGASRSYGIQCARLAGLPPHVVTRATRLLTRFEKHAPRNAAEQLSLFGLGGSPVDAPSAAAPVEVPEPPPDPVREQLAALDPDALTPRQAHEALYALRRLL